MEKVQKLVIVGGVAGGMSAAARARRLSQSTEIIVLERGPHVSYANCGLPYFVGQEIEHEADLLLQTPETLAANLRLDVRVRHEVLAVEPAAHRVLVKNLETGEQSHLTYDALILATGARPLLPPIPGLQQEHHFVVRNVPDAVAIDSWIKQFAPQRAVIVGGGYIGLEMAEQLVRRGLHVAIAEAMPQVMAPLDEEMAALLHKELVANGVDLYLSDGVKSFSAPLPNEDSGSSPAASMVELKSGVRLPAGIVILGLGVRPENGLAEAAGLQLGERGGVIVDESMRTSDPHIYAVGDMVEVLDTVTGAKGMVPLAGPANRQGRIAADNIFGLHSTYKGTIGTAVLRLFRLTAAVTGANERTLRRLGIPFEALHLHPQNHAGYYPGAQRMAMKILFSPEDGRLLGAQVVGKDGVDKRIDVLATALQAGFSVHQLAELELAYAPPVGSAKDAVNLAGMAAQNVLDGRVRLAQWRQIPTLNRSAVQILDVRSSAERDAGFIPDSLHIPLPELRERLREVDKNKEVVVYCQSGQRSYNATVFLLAEGYCVRNLSGGYLTWKGSLA